LHVENLIDEFNCSLNRERSSRRSRSGTGDGSSASSVSRHNLVANSISRLGRAGLTGEVLLEHVPEETTAELTLSFADDALQHGVGERKLVCLIFYHAGVSGLSNLITNESIHASFLVSLHVEVDLRVKSTSLFIRAFMEFFVFAHIVSHDIQASSVLAFGHEIDDFRELLKR